MADQQSQQLRRVAGKEVRFNDSRGYGFVSPVHGSDNIFVHQTAIVPEEGYRTLNIGDEVVFTPVEEEGRLKAVDVVVVARHKKEVTVRKSVRSWGRTGSGDGCFKCGDSGHIAKDCARKDGGGELRREIECFNCGGIGHIRSDCPSSKNVKKNRDVVDSGCYNFGKIGQKPRDYGKKGVETRRNSNSNGGVVGGGSNCYNCGEFGHTARDCSKEAVDNGHSNGRNCYNCGQFGHMARDCSKEGVKSYGEYGNKCFTCGKLGHKARECSKGAVETYDSGNGGTCFKCHESGHWARDCVKAGGGVRNSSNGGPCFSCGKAGHYARECIYPAAPRRNNNGGNCFNCGQPGHRANDCYQATA